MSGRYLLTPSLYNSWRYYQAVEDGGEARAELITTLKREEITPNEKMLAGRQFEDDVQAATKRVFLGGEHKPSYCDCVEEVAAIVAGGLWQERIHYNINFRDHGDFLLYCRADVIKGPHIYDIKFLANYDVGKYFASIQHLAEMVGANIGRFAYLISNGSVVWREDYTLTQGTEQELHGRLTEMLNDIASDRELSALYREHWRAKW